MATETVTVLFTDLVGSTELSSRLGPEGTETLRQTHFGLLRGAIQIAGGTEVKNLGDGLMVAFTSLSRALACAVGMQQAIERHNRRGRDAELSVRIGVSTGEATEEDGDYFGDPVVEAARLCNAAAGGQILATEVVKLLAGRHATQEFTSVGELELKGIPEPVPTVEVVWEPAPVVDEGSGGQIPLPARLVGASAESLFAFFGRTDELARLGETDKASSTGHQLRVTLISGEPGIGKTTLVAQAARSAHAAGSNVVYGNCEEGLGVPYQPWIAALSQLVEHVDPSVLQNFVDARGPGLARLVPELARRLSLPVPDAGTDADSERFLLLEGIARLLEATSATAPIVLVLDDLHWVDAASLQVLRHLVASALPMAVHVVGTYRESDLNRSHPLTGALADLRRESSVDRIDLVGLTDTDIIDLLGAAAGQEMAEDGVALAHALRRETAGNPFFLVEVIRHLAETDAFVQDDTGRWVVAGDLDDLGLPSSVREVVAHRVARLGHPTERALSLAAVIGRDFDLDLLAEIARGDEDELIDLLDGAIGAGLVSETETGFGRYRFVHALIQHTLYQDLSAPRRQRTHQRIAEALEARADDDELVAELAHHWLAATRPADAAKAIHYARRAGDAALAAHAPADAAGWFAQALELHDRQGVGDDGERCRLLVGLGTAQRQAGDPAFRATLLDAGHIALARSDAGLLVLVALSRDPSRYVAAEPDPERLAVIEAALAAVGTTDPATRARLLACLADEIDPRDVARRCEVAAEAIEVAHGCDDATLLFVFGLALTTLTTPDTLDRRLDETTSGLALIERTGDTLEGVQIRYCRAQAVAESGEIAEVDEQIAEMTAAADRTGIPVWYWYIHLMRSWRHLLGGRTAEAEADSNTMLEVGMRAGFEVTSNTFGAQLLQRFLQQGQLDQIVDVASQGLADNPTSPAWRTAVMNVYCELGRMDEARDLFEVGRATDFTDLPFDITWLQAMGQYADCAADVGDPESAPRLYELIAPYAKQFAFLGAVDWGPVARPLGRLCTLLGRYDDAEAHLEAALATVERMGAPYWTARTQLDLADLCLTRLGTGDEGRARSLIAEAQATIDRYGYAGLQPRSDRLATRS